MSTKEEFDLSVPNSLRKMDKSLQEVYLKLVSMCLENLDMAINYPDSDKQFASMKVRISDAQELIFVQFKPSIKQMKIQIHIRLNKLTDPKKICDITMPSYPQWSAFFVRPGDSDLEYYFHLIKQAYSEILDRSKTVATKQYSVKPKQTMIKPEMIAISQKKSEDGIGLGFPEAKVIIEHAVSSTRVRWKEYAVHLKDLNEIFLHRAFEQQGFEAFKFTPLLRAREVFSIDSLGSILEGTNLGLKYDEDKKGFDSEFYQGLRKNKFGLAGKAFYDAVYRIFRHCRI